MAAGHLSSARKSYWQLASFQNLRPKWDKMGRMEKPEPEAEPETETEPEPEPEPKKYKLETFLSWECHLQ